MRYEFFELIPYQPILGHAFLTLQCWTYGMVHNLQTAAVFIWFIYVPNSFERERKIFMLQPWRIQLSETYFWPLEAWQHEHTEVLRNIEQIYYYEHGQ